MNYIEAARSLIALGWHIFPIVEGTKQPATPHGCLDALPTWVPWLHHPYNSIAVCAGPSKLVIIDLDVHKETCPNPCPLLTGREWLVEAIAAHGKGFTATVRQVTPTGGGHLFYACPEGLELGPMAGLWWRGKRYHVDVRAGNSYVVVAPSLHPNGERYEWDEGADPWGQEMLTLPHGMRRWLTDLQPKPALAPASIRIHISQGDVNKRRAGYGAKLRVALPADMAAATPGVREITGNATAYHLGRCVAGGRVDEGDARSILQDIGSAAASSGLEAHEVRKIVTRSYEDGRSNPLPPLADRPIRKNAIAIIQPRLR
jgi:Bifunctional DNA primase/polymerase, N-terminal